MPNVPLQEYVEARLSDIGKQVDQRFVGSDKHLETRIEELRIALMMLSSERKQQLDERFRAFELAFERSLAAQQRRDEAANEWRGALDDVTGKSMSRIEWDTAHRLLLDRFESVVTVLNTVDRRLVLIEGRQGYASLTMIMSIVAIFITLALGFTELIYRSH